MIDDDLTRAQWRKSSFSGNSGNCVEVAELDDTVAVRDSKDPDGSVLVVTHDEWHKLIERLKAASV